MASSNGVNPVSNGPAKPAIQQTNERVPRRIVLLTGDEQSDAGDVLLELRGDDITGKRLHTNIQQHAAAHPGHWVAAEWLGNLGWTRFLWCKK